MATVGLDFERTLSASSVDLRHAIAQALREIGFQITVDQITRIEAKRGNLLGTSLMLKKAMPVLAIFEVAPTPNGRAVVAHLTDNIHSLVGKTWGVNRQYREIFDEVRRRVDLALARLDPAAAQSFGEARFWSRAAEIGVLEGSNAISAKVSAGAVDLAGRALDGSTESTPSAWKGVDSVTFRSSAGMAVRTLAETQAALGIAVMVASHPDPMQPNLAPDVEAFAAEVERQLTATAGRAVLIEVSDDQRQVFEFLTQQAQIRAELPLRTLHTCRSCRLDKITNPEYERIAARNEKIGDIVAGVGATISAKGISPTFVLGQVFKLKRLDPAYVCSRCQGMEADERVVTFCPSCAELMRDVVLAVCPRCGFDFRTKIGQTPLWVAVPDKPVEPEVVAEAGPAPVASAPVATRPPAPIATAPVPAQPEIPPPPPPPASAYAAVSAPRTAWPTAAEVPLGSPPPGRRSGWQCQLCRRDYPTLWRVVIATPAGFEERFICGTTPACQMASFAPALQA
jgi:hypothetical protein